MDIDGGNEDWRWYELSQAHFGCKGQNEVDELGQCIMPRGEEAVVERKARLDSSEP
ncbi:unnamed protein product [Penicillium camemberti]|uniref:Str. FM013 n=1 Tax=Penicillium camemberti (strain FM 013) TaxID=1429867 RepID=A0A0G4NZ31_PENC3|nr:unnamed protein product [Penicillium camemberti]